MSLTKKDLSHFSITDLIQETRHLRTRFRINGITAMSRGNSRGQKSDNTSNRGRVCIFYQNETMI